MNKKIANVVFYKFWDPTREDAMQQACIFYEDGTILNTTHEEGLEAAYELANAEKLTGKQFRAALNRDKIYTMSGADFERRYQEFVKLSREEVAAAVNAEMVNIEATRRTAQQRTQATNNQPRVTPQVQNDDSDYDISRNQAPRSTTEDNQRLAEFQRNMDQIIAYGEERLRRLREEANRQYQADPQINQQINQEINELEAEMKAQQQRTAAEVQRILNEQQARKAYQGQTPVQSTSTTAQQGIQAQPKQTTSGSSAIPVVPVFVPTGETQNTATAGQNSAAEGQTTAEKKASQSANGTKKPAKNQVYGKDLKNQKLVRE